MKSISENSVAAQSAIAEQNDSPYVEVINPNADAAIILICEHASNSIPEEFTRPVTEENLLNQHIALDLGARSLALRLSDLLDAPLICSKVSRLVYDCNRPPESASAIPVKSELFEIPGNQNLNPQERQRRIDQVYTPFHNTVSNVIKIKQLADINPALVTIHSFTPSYFNQTRKTEIGILHDEDTRLADQMLSHASQFCDYLVERNKPYGPEDGVTHTLTKQAIANSLPNVMLEIKNDLLSTALEIRLMATIIARMLSKSLSKMAVSS